MMLTLMSSTAISRMTFADNGTTEYMELIAQGSPPMASYRIDEVAKMLGVSRGTVYAEVRAGRLRTVKIRECTIVLAEELDRYIQAKQKADSANMTDKSGCESQQEHD
jgi:excisionase family DNA binding protein